MGLHSARSLEGLPIWKSAPTNALSHPCRGKIMASQSMTPTTERRASMSEKFDRMAKLAAAGLIMFVGGLLLLLIPVLGWVLGPLFIVIGALLFFCSPGIIFLPLWTIEGSCPHCAHPLSVQKGEKAVTCKVCRSRVIIHPAYFCPVGVQPPVEQSDGPMDL